MQAYGFMLHSEKKGFTTLIKHRDEGNGKVVPVLD
jgi:hypothetical protein